jgi:TonB-linked SusC/RagA family outer membrane protein
MKRITAILVCLAFIGLSVCAQDIQITGTVTGFEDGNALPGVSVVVKGTNTGTVTNNDGNYTIKAPGNSVLEFSFVGMQTEKIDVGDQPVINVTLQPEAIEMAEVVVTALGFKKEMKALGYAQQSVNNEEITKAAQPNLVNSLQGKVAGISVTSSSGNPGASSFITIRGSRFLLDNNQPLFVVDGQPIVSNAIFVDDVTQDRVSSTDATSRSLDINPEDIESVEVLKGPSASALYGLRASNGVILISTKSGKGSSKGKVTFSTSYTLDKVTRLPELQNKYAQGSDGEFQQNTSMSWGPIIDSMPRYYNEKINDTVTPGHYDNITPFFRNGSVYTADLGFSNGDENSNFYASLGYMEHQGVIINTNNKRYTGKISGDYKIKKNLTVGGSAQYTHMDGLKPPNGSNLSNPLFTVYFAPRSYDLWGIPYATEDDPYQQIHYRAAMDNPRWSTEHNEFSEKNDRIIGNIHLEYNPIQLLKVRYQLGTDYLANHQKEIYELGSGETSGRTDTLPAGGQITDFAHLQKEINSNLSLEFDKDLLSDLNLNVILGNEIYDSYTREFNENGTGIDIGGLHNISNTSSQISTETIYKRRTVGFYGAATIGYKSMLYLNATGRRDAVSNLARGNRAYFYPSIGGSFIFTELFDIPEKAISFGKIRVTYAKVGQSYDDDYATQNIFDPGSSTSGFLKDGIEFPFQGQNARTHSVILKSKDLKPQNSYSFEVGGDLRFFRNRLEIDYTYYSTRVVDQIFRVPIAGSTGYTEELRNAGELKAVGHELLVNVTPVSSSFFKWDVSVNFTKYKNKVIKLAEGVSNIYLGGFEAPSIRAFEGETYPSIFGIGYLRDENGKIVLLDDPSSPYHGMPIADPTSKVIGSVEPDFTMGIANTFTIKGIALSVLIDWKQGGQMYSGNNMLGRMYGMLKVTEDRETPVILDGVKGYLNNDGDIVVTGENDIAIYRNDKYWNDVLGDLDEAHVMETSYLRLREISLSYSIPPKILSKSFIQGITVSFVGRNLALWSSYPNFDPESSTTGAVNGQGMEYVAFPQTKSFGGKLNFTF